MKLHDACVLFFLFLLIPLATALADINANEDSKDNANAKFEENISKISKRLNLTDQQIQEVRPILQMGFQERRSIFQKYGFNPKTGEKPGYRELRNMKKELDLSRNKTNEKLSKILTSEQMEELNQIRQEQKEKIKKQMEASKK